MNILILSWRGPSHPNEGGAELSTMEHAKAWVAAGHEVFLFTSSYKNAKDTEDIDGVRVIRKGSQILGVHFFAPFWFFFGKHPKFDLVIDQFHGIPFFTPLYVKSRKLAFIHEVAKEVWEHNPWPHKNITIFSKLAEKIEPSIFKIFYKNTPFLTVSESTKSDLIEWGINRKNIFVVHNGVTHPKIKISRTKESRLTGTYLGALSKDKGIEDAIKCFAEILRKDDNWQFWIIGKGTNEYIQFLKELCKKLEISEKVKFWGFASEKKKFELLAKSHVLINPSIREGWGLVNIEANVMGVPVVAYNVAGVKDSVIDGKTGVLVKVGEYKSLAEQCLNLASDTKKYENLVNGALKWSQKFSWERSTEESLGIIESI